MNAPRQERPTRALHVPLLRAALLGSIALSLAACANGTSLNPVDWWHDLEGGPLDEARPPPPNADAPYPNLATVPPKGTPAAPAVPDQIAKALIADRDNAHYDASLSPLQAPTPANTLPPPGQTPPSNADAPKATLQAATAPPPPPTPPANNSPPQSPPPQGSPPSPKAAPVGAVQTAPLAAPAQRTAAASPPPTTTPGAAPGTAIIRTAPGADLPPVPDQPPPMVQLSGVNLPTSVAPTPPVPTPPKPPAPPAPITPGAPVTIAFTPGSAVLPTGAAANLKQLAATRGNAPISVVGYGDASSSQADAQAAALPLALARARAIADGLTAAGVPSGSIRIAAEAEGQGGAARIVSN